MGANLSVKASDAIRAAEKQGSIELILSDCSLDGFPKELVKKFKNIRKLVLSTNYIKLLPKQIKGFESLEVLKLDNNELNLLPNEILDITSLVYLNVARNQMTQFPEPVDSLRNLRKLDLSGNKLQMFPAGLASLSLETLKYGNSNISEIPDALFQITTLKSLHLPGNRLDTLPDRLTVLSQLLVLNIENNPISQLPNVITNLTNLTNLNASHTSISDIEDYRFDRLPNLTVLSLSSSRISKFSTHIGHCSKLELLDLAVNMLKTIPREIGHTYRSLRTLYLNENQLTSLPGELNMLDPTAKIELRGNPLEYPFDAWKDSMVEFFELLMPYCVGYGPSCTIEGESIASCPALKGTSFVILARDFLGRKRVTGKDSVTAKIVRVSVDGESPYEVETIVKDHTNGRYEVFYNPKSPGIYTVTLMCNGLPVKNSPYTMNVQ